MSPNQKIIITSLIFVAIVLATGFLIIYPIFNDIRKNSEEFLIQKRALTDFQTRSENLREFQAVYRNFKANLDKINTLFIDSETPINFIEFLEKNAQDSQGDLKITPGIPQRLEGDPWPSMNFQLNFTSSFPNFLRFLEKLESGPYLIEIIKVDLRRLTEKDIKSKKFEEFSAGGTNAAILIKAFAK